ncbi:50S ribosomal protein L25/general stress protein Ctc [uncultured Mycolicibacterium sp.]|uniref:50S ribosomal protein L25/general stress protein Ctc n=1 Tax=uncultured Mycolicibacterium sp. TaxID=2320817 RepID=UPI0026040CAD|nr:50S ribosomal protein L25/general stress protein Ctc [uncultured Mycolicibacterium sp.]
MAKNTAQIPDKLTATVRKETGKGASRRARREGRIPAVLYGHGTEPRHLELPAREFAAVLRHHGANAVLTLDIEGTEQLALTKALDIHPIKRTIQHADLLVVQRGEKVTVAVTVVVEGDPAPGGLVTQELNEIEIEAEALSIPEQLVVSVADLPAGTNITAGQIELPEGATLVTDADTLVVHVIESPSAEQLEGEGAAAPGEEAAE